MNAGKKEKQKETTVIASVPISPNITQTFSVSRYLTGWHIVNEETGEPTTSSWGSWRQSNRQQGTIHLAWCCTQQAPCLTLFRGCEPLERGGEVRHSRGKNTFTLPSMTKRYYGIPLMVKTLVNSSLITRDHFIPGSRIMELRTVRSHS
jgi:hypothetical protein